MGLIRTSIDILLEMLCGKYPLIQYTTTDGGFTEKCLKNAPKVLFVSPIDKSPSRFLPLIGHDDYSRRFSVSPKEVLPFAFPSHSAPQDSNELVGAARLGVGPGHDRMVVRQR